MKDVDVKHYKPISLIDHSRVRLIFSMNTELYTRFPLLQKNLLDNLKNFKNRHLSAVFREVYQNSFRGIS